MSEKLLQQIFKKVYGKPSWNVHKGYGTSLSFEFGKPKLKISKNVIQPNKKTGRKFPRRWVRVRGDWSLFIFCCDWVIQQSNRKICDSNSPTVKINQGCAILKGQILTKVILDPKTKRTDFHFDLGGHLQTKPYKKEDKPSPMWSLYCPNKRVFWLRSDSNYSYQVGNKPSDERWSPFVF
ncbi:MAG: hypothetical protein ACLQU6_12180 [Limisphaerales bacterium]